MTMLQCFLVCNLSTKDKFLTRSFSFFATAVDGHFKWLFLHLGFSGYV